MVGVTLWHILLSLVESLLQKMALTPQSLGAPYPERLEA